MKLSRAQIVIGVIMFVLIIDQALKIYIKTHFYLSESIDILGLSWAKLLFIENEGMAFGLTFGEKCFGREVNGDCQGLVLTKGTAKIILSLFRIVLVGFLLYLMHTLIKSKEKIGLLVSFALIIAGAIGNILDSAFFGLIFSESGYNSIATAFPEGGGYTSFLHGNVVDMLYFPLLDTQWPEWTPWVGGDRFQFFRPIFNLADASISVGVASILLFYRKFFAQPSKGQKTNDLTKESVDLLS